jgi:hypothetical protein
MDLPGKAFYRHPPDGRIEAEIAALDEHWQVTDHLSRLQSYRRILVAGAWVRRRGFGLRRACLDSIVEFHTGQDFW